MKIKGLSIKAKNTLLFIFCGVLLGCDNDSNIICACYVFPTMSYSGHCYVEVNDSGIMSVAYGMGSDIASHKIENCEEMFPGSSLFISKKPYFRDIVFYIISNELIGRHMQEPSKYRFSMIKEDYNEVMRLKSEISSKNVLYSSLDKDAIAAVLMINGYTCCTYYHNSIESAQDRLIHLLIDLASISCSDGLHVKMERQ